MNIVFWQMVLAVIENGFLAGVSFDVALVKLPTRRRIGPVAYAQFARGNDLGFKFDGAGRERVLQFVRPDVSDGHLFAARFVDVGRHQRS